MVYLKNILSGVCSTRLIAALLFVITSGSMHAAFEGRIRVTIRDTIRSKSIPVTIIYASDLESGDNKPLVGTSTNTIPNFSVVVFGHGFQLPVTVYRSWASNICQVSPSTIVILPETGAELFPSHGDFALDMVECLEYMQREGRRSGSIWNGHIRNDNIIAGHSMGGGCAMLAAKEVLQSRTLNLRGVIAMAPAETNPSATAAAATVSVPTLVLAGLQDCVTPLQTTVQPIYNAIAAPCKTLAVIPGASHCQFADSSFICSLGELNCRATITRTAQQVRTNQYVSLFLRRRDSVARAIENTQIQTTMSFFTGNELPTDTTVACEGDTITLMCSVPNSYLLWLPDSVRGQQLRYKVRRGTSVVTLVSTQCFGETRLSHVVASKSLPSVSVQGRTTLCRGDSVVLRAIRSPDASVVWSTGETSDTIIVRKAGTYRVQARTSCGSVSDSISIQYSGTTSVPIRTDGDTLFCDGIGLVTVSCNFDSTEYRSIAWNTGDTTRSLRFTRSGLYVLHAELFPARANGCVGTTDTIRLRIQDIVAPEPVITRRGDTLWSTKADSYTWLKNGVVMPGRDSQYCIVNEPGDYRVRVRSLSYHNCPSLSGTFTVSTILRSDNDGSDDQTTPGDTWFVQYSTEIVLRNIARGERIRLLNILGETIREVAVDNPETRIATSDLPCGMYVVVAPQIRPRTMVVCR